MSTFDAAPAFLGHCYRQAFLAKCEDYALAWSTYCMGGEL